MRVLLIKLLTVTCSVLFAGSMLASGAGIDGTWISERQVGAADGKTYTHTTTIALKNEAGVLTGTMVQVSEAPWMKGITGRTIEIEDGKLDGGKFLFMVKLEMQNGVRTATYEGSLDGDQLTGTTKYRGIGITEPFKAKRK